MFGWTGIGLQLASAVAVFAAEGVYLSGNTNNSPSTGVGVAVLAGLGGILIGVVLELIGAPYVTEGQKKEFDAVNAYNSDLVDGLLKGPR